MSLFPGYEIGEALGSGANGTVYRGTEAATGRAVAVKVIQAVSDQQRERIRREVLALKQLQLPGVVRLLDHGRSGDAFVLVMELVEGAPFPGEGRIGWDDIVEPLESLLSALSGVHDAGIVHRDLKPANILVSAKGRATLLDFGLARGAAVGSTMTQSGAVVGTPAYLSPEQICGERPDARSDLYAVGLMVYRALTGLLPHEHSDAQTMMLRRLRNIPTPLHRLAPEVPRAAADCIDRLLSIARDRRPPTARHVLEAIAGVSQRTLWRLPLLGDRQPIHTACEALRSGHSFSVAGSVGAGRSRFCQEVADSLQQEGLSVRWLNAGQRPYQTLVQLLGIEMDASVRLNGFVQQLTDALLPFGQQHVLIADHLERCDRSSRRILDRLIASHRLRVLVGMPSGQVDHIIVPLNPEALQPLFDGPERLVHLPSRAANVLHQRTMGRPKRIDREVRRWLHTGVASEDGIRLTLSIAELNRLEQATVPPSPTEPAPEETLDSLELELASWVRMTWPNSRTDILADAMGEPHWEVEARIDELLDRGVLAESADGVLFVSADIEAPLQSGERTDMHSAIADTLEPGASGRLFHLLASGRTAEAPAEALRLADVHHDDPTAAIAAVRDAYRNLDDQGPTTRGLLERWATAAIRSHQDGHLDEVYRAISAQAEARGLVTVSRLLELGLRLRRGRTDVSGDLEALGSLEEPTLELWRRELMLLCARVRSRTAEAELLEAYEPWALAAGSVERGAWLGWMGWAAYRRGDFSSATDYHLQEASQQTDRLRAARALGNAASAALEAFDFEQALEIGQRALRAARSLRSPESEARAEWVLRNARYRSGETLPADTELVDAARTLELHDLEALVCLTESAFAWRQGAHKEALSLAGRAVSIWRTLSKQHTLNLMRLFVGGIEGHTAAADDEVISLARQCGIAGFGVQFLAFHALAVGPRVEWLSTGLELAAEVPKIHWSDRLDILSVDECLHALEHGHL